MGGKREKRSCDAAVVVVASSYKKRISDEQGRGMRVKHRVDGCSQRVKKEEDGIGIVIPKMEAKKGKAAIHKEDEEEEEDRPQASTY